MDRKVSVNAAVTRDKVFDLYRSEAARVIGVDESRIVDSARFVEDLGADSLAVVEILMFIEEDLEIEVPQHLLNDMTTVGQVVDLIHERC